MIVHPSREQFNFQNISKPNLFRGYIKKDLREPEFKEQNFDDRWQTTYMRDFSLGNTYRYDNCFITKQNIDNDTSSFPPRPDFSMFDFDNHVIYPDPNTDDQQCLNINNNLSNNPINTNCISGINNKHVITSNTNIPAHHSGIPTNNPDILTNNSNNPMNNSNIPANNSNIPINNINNNINNINSEIHTNVQSSHNNYITSNNIHDKQFQSPTRQYTTNNRRKTQSASHKRIQLPKQETSTIVDNNITNIPNYPLDNNQINVNLPGKFNYCTNQQPNIVPNNYANRNQINLNQNYNKVISPQNNQNHPNKSNFPPQMTDPSIINQIKYNKNAPKVSPNMLLLRENGTQTENIYSLAQNSKGRSPSNNFPSPNPISNTFKKTTPQKKSVKSVKTRSKSHDRNPNNNTHPNDVNKNEMPGEPQSTSYEIFDKIVKTYIDLPNDNDHTTLVDKFDGRNIINKKYLKSDRIKTNYYKEVLEDPPMGLLLTHSYITEKSRPSQSYIRKNQIAGNKPLIENQSNVEQISQLPNNKSEIPNNNDQGFCNDIPNNPNLFVDPNQNLQTNIPIHDDINQNIDVNNQNIVSPSNQIQQSNSDPNRDIIQKKFLTNLYEYRRLHPDVEINPTLLYNPSLNPKYLKRGETKINLIPPAGIKSPKCDSVQQILSIYA